jgi:transcriptional regulator with XRE-family HTH domain
VTALYKHQLGALIRRTREELGMTQKQLADAAHVAESQTVSRWERGERAPQDLEAVAAALQTTAAAMLRQLEPIGQRDRRSMNAEPGSQLDRIERSLIQLAERLGRLEAVEQLLQLVQGLVEHQNALLQDQSELISELRASVAEQREINSQTDDLLPLVRDVLDPPRADREGQPAGPRPTSRAER